MNKHYIKYKQMIRPLPIPENEPAMQFFVWLSNESHVTLWICPSSKQQQQLVLCILFVKSEYFSAES